MIGVSSLDPSTVSVVLPLESTLTVLPVHESSIKIKSKLIKCIRYASLR